MKRLADSLRVERDRVIRAQADAIDNAADEALRMMKERTVRGIGQNERRFISYRPSTARQKGRSQPVTLIDTGKMLNDLYVRELSSMERHVRFRSKAEEQKGRWHQFGTRRMAARRWFGLTIRQSRQLFGRMHDRMHLVAKSSRQYRIRLEFGSRKSDQ